MYLLLSILIIQVRRPQEQHKKLHRSFSLSSTFLFIVQVVIDSQIEPQPRPHTGSRAKGVRSFRVKVAS